MVEYRAKLAAASADRLEKRRAERAAVAAAKKAEASSSRAATAIARKERQRQAQKAWRAANKDRMRELIRRWKDAHPDKVKADKRGRCGKSNKRRREALSKLQKGRCGYCRDKLVTGKTHIDHIMPRKLDGPNSRSNLQLLCEACNLSKGAKHPIEHARSIGRLL